MTQAEPNLILQYVLPFIIPSLLVGLGTVAGWFIKARIDRNRGIEENLREQRAELYLKILEPYIRVWSTNDKKNEPRAIKDVGSFEYRQVAFRLALLGSDEVVKAWNDFAQFMYAQEKVEAKDPIKLFRMYADLLLEIRKSIGNEKTKLEPKEMLSWMIKDIDTIFSEPEGKQKKAV